MRWLSELINAERYGEQSAAAALEVAPIEVAIDTTEATATTTAKPRKTTKAAATKTAKSSKTRKTTDKPRR